jgi:outer membrane protein assembly factor BamB
VQSGVVVGEVPWIVVLDARTGAKVFSYRDPSGSSFFGAPSIAHGVLYQANTDGTLLAFQPGGSGESTGLTPQHNEGAVRR